MPASLIPNGKQQFIDINGAPLVAGTVGMYFPNTLVKKNTWQDAGQTVLNTNPIVLDSRGQAVIYGNGAYRQVVRDALGNLIWDKPVSASGTSHDIYINAADFGFLPTATGAINDTAMRAALQFVSDLGTGGTIFIPAGNYDCFLTTPWPGIANTTILCDQNAAMSRTDATESNWWTYINISLFSIMGYGTWRGNSISTTANSGQFVSAYLDGDTASDDMVGGQFQVKLINFKGDDWMFFYIINGPTDFSFRDGIIWDGCYFKSLPGNCRGPATISIPSAALCLYGPDDGTGDGRITGWKIGKCTFDIPNIKTAVRIWQGVTNTSIDQCLVIANGTDGIIQDNTGAYAYLIGNENNSALGSTDPDNISVRAPLLLHPLSAGIYIPSASDPTGTRGTIIIDCAGGRINGTTDTNDGTIRKGAIAGSGIGNLIIQNLYSTSCVSGIDVSMIENDSLTVEGADIQDFSHYAIRIATVCTTGQSTGPIILSDLKIATTQNTSQAIKFLEPVAGAKFGPTTVSIISLDCPTTGIDISCATSVDKYHSFQWSAQDIRGCAVAYFTCTNNTSPIAWDSVNSYRGDTAGNYDYRFKLGAATNLCVGQTLFDDVRSGDNGAWYGVDAEGVFRGIACVQYTNTATTPERRATAGGFGSVKPSAPVQDGAVNQNLLATAPAAGSYTPYFVCLGGSWLTASVPAA